MNKINKRRVIKEEGMKLINKPYCNIVKILCKWLRKDGSSGFVVGLNKSFNDS